LHVTDEMFSFIIPLALFELFMAGTATLYDSFMVSASRISAWQSEIGL
jgi:hypothetical protein